ncbi:MULTISPECIES: SCO2322 family protein [unclassified Streptomyces]|uniref:SCO2322 family protein n=1 Tax=unclassified Streptomyces TaxID=2593676 RepID=UPI0004C599DF|nr:SCO2322 family protein [Streptomyces sp. NRRL F-2747]
MRRSPIPLVLAFGILLTLLASSPALAAGYRYWSFWEGPGGQWQYATQGPSTARPADGSALGFRFSVSQDAAAEAAKPRAAADFAAVCGATAAVEGRKRIAVVVDFGVPADAPAGDAPPQDAPRTACAQVAPDATAAEALAQAAKPLRYNSAALLCAVSGYPKQGCGEPIADAQEKPRADAAPKPPAQAEPADGGPSTSLLVGLAAVAALAAAAVWQSRRRR